MIRFRGYVLTEAQLFLALALIIGMFSGLAVVCFRVAIEWSRLQLLGSSLTPSPARLLIVIPLVGLVVGLLVEFLFPTVRGSGVNQTKAAVYIYEGFIPFRTVIGKFLTSALGIGSGQSLGPEDPSLQIGAGIASACGRGTGLPRHRLRLIAPLGAAAGLAAAFNSPITAVLFVFEEVLGAWSAVALGAVVLSAVSSVVVQHIFLGYQPLFRVPQYHLEHTGELAVYAALGILGGLAALAFVKLAIYFRARLRNRRRAARIVQPAIAGFFIALVAIWFPQVTGAGYEYIDQAMHDQYPWQMLALLAALKIVTTVTSFAGGTPGGLFAPTLFIGAMVGGAVCGATERFAPWFTGSTGVYALIGMGTVFAGIMRAPITSVFMILEVSGNYSIVLPVMISNTIAYLISRQYQRETIFEVLSRQDGISLPSMEQQRESIVHRVEEAMRPDVVALGPEVRVASALERIAQNPGNGALLVQPRDGVWTVTTADALRAFVDEGKGDLALGSVFGLAAPVPVVHPDESLESVLRRVGSRPFLPVVHRADAQRVLGIVTVEDILSAYGRR